MFYRAITSKKAFTPFDMLKVCLLLSQHIKSGLENVFNSQNVNVSKLFHSVPGMTVYVKLTPRGKEDRVFPTFKLALNQGALSKA